MGMLVLYLFLALGVSFVCSLLESILLSVPNAHISSLVEKQDPAGPLLASMKANLDRPLAAILSLNTIAHTVGAAGVGLESTKLLGDAWIGATSAILTVLILLFSEVVPKSFGAAHARGLAPTAAVTIRWMIIGLYPLVIVCEKLSAWMSGKSAHGVMNREEVRMLAMIGQNVGELEPHETAMIANVMDLPQRRVRDVMTPRTVVDALQADRTVADVFNAGEPPRFARMPVYEDSLDKVVGKVHRYDLVAALQRGEGDTPVRQHVRPVHLVPEVADLAAVLRQFIERREQLFIAVDEYGGTEGIVTLEDILEELIGHEIVDETDTTDDMRRLASERNSDP